MNIQAVGSVSSLKTCQPLKGVSFARSSEKVPLSAAETSGTDTFTPGVPESNIQDKYEAACLVAAYYRQQCQLRDELLTRGFCCV